MSKILIADLITDGALDLNDEQQGMVIGGGGGVGSGGTGGFIQNSEQSIPTKYELKYYFEADGMHEGVE
jgi:hypothetical protein